MRHATLAHAPRSRAASTATLIGFTAVLMWSLLALLTAATGTVPPFLLAALTFAIGGAVGLVWLAVTKDWRGLAQPPAVWALGVAGLFGYHALYFTALRNAPPVEAGLIAYLWPLLIVVFSALLPGERLRWFHVAGALFGLGGTALIVTKGGGVAFERAYGFGYLAAFGCALTWSAYSILSRRFREVPTGVVAGFCLASAALSALAHVLFETTRWPESGPQWLAVLALGLMPVGAAFYVWDHGVKRGDIQLLGAASYLAPLLSTLILILAGFAAFSTNVALAAILITGGAALASKEILGRRPAQALAHPALFLLAALAITPSAVQAREPRAFWSGQTLYENCTGGDLPVCVGYVMAILDATNRKEFGASSIQSFAPSYPHYCYPDGEDIGSAVDAVVAYLRDHSEARRGNASMLTIRALAKAYPCPYPLGRRAGQRLKPANQRPRR